MPPRLDVVVVPVDGGGADVVVSPEADAVVEVATTVVDVARTGVVVVLTPFSRVVVVRRRTVVGGGAGADVVGVTGAGADTGVAGKWACSTHTATNTAIRTTVERRTARPNGRLMGGRIRVISRPTGAG